MSDVTRTLHNRYSTVERCTAMVTSSLKGRRCRYESEADSDPPRSSQHMYSADHKGHRGRYMSRFYLKSLRPTLAAKMEEVVEEMGSLDNLDLTEELSPMRITAGDAVAEYAKVLEMPVTPETEAKITEMKLLTGQMMSSKLREVADMAGKAGDIQELKTRLNGAFAQAMTSVISAIAHSAWEVWGDEYRVKEFEELIRTKLSVKGIDVEGTSLTPYRDALAMDETIPSNPEEAAVQSEE